MAIPLKRRRSGNPAWAVATLVIVGCGGRLSTRDDLIVAAPSVAPPHSDTVAVYQRALEILYESTSETPRVIVLLDSATTGAGRYSPDPPFRLSPAIDSHVEASALKSYARASSRRSPIQKDLKRPIRIQFVSTTELATFPALGATRPNDADRNGQSPDPFWDEFRRRFPGAWGLASATLIGFSDDADQALVQIRHVCGNRCVRAESMFFEKRGGTWFIESRFPEESQDWIGQGDLRYVGPDAKSRADYFRARDAAAVAAADSIRRDSLPRRIVGTVTNGRAGSPVSHSEIFLASPQLPRGTFLHVTADHSGRFEIRNPPIGALMIGAQCPGSEQSEEKVLAGDGFYLRPGGDTSITLVSPNIRRCLKSDRVFPLTSGWLESSSATSLAAPTPDEGRVYAAAIRYLIRQQTHGKIVAVSNVTIRTCRFSKRCGRVQLQRLVNEGVVDTSTLDAFKRQTHKPDLLNPEFARLLGLRVMTEDEIRYLAHEAEPRAGPMDKLENESEMFWIGFHNLYGRGARIVSMTRASFNKTHTEALLEVRIDSATLFWERRPTMLLLRRIGQNWRVVNGDLGRGHTSGRWIKGACVAASPAGSVSKRDIDALTGDFDITLVSVAENEFSTVMPVRIARNTIPHWEGFGAAPPANLKRIGHSFEVLDKSGLADIEATSVLSIIGISKNIARNPNILTFDGAYDNLTIEHITESGFSGSYVGGVFGDSNFGYFCAVRGP
jgi:hypothetical protein